MAFAVEDFEDLIRLLEERPEWRKRLRDSLVSDDIARLERGLADLLESGRQLQTSMADFRAASEARLTAIESRIDSLDKRMDSLERNLTSRMDTMTNEFGLMYESRYLDSPESYFVRWLRRPQRVRVTDLDEVDDAFQSGDLTDEEFVHLGALDLLVKGRDKATGRQTVYLAVEVSRTINLDDVDRAERRSLLLRRLGLDVRPAVGGARITDEAQRRADEVSAVVSIVRM